MVTKALLYLHGFNSSPASEKAQQTKRFFEYSGQASAKGSDFAYKVVVPALPAEPAAAITMIDHLLESESVSGLIGSSLGGYYSLYMHAKHGLPAVLINPAVRPYELLSDYVGINTNMYTGEEYEVKPEHMDQLKALDVQAQSLDLTHLMLLTESADEVLPYQQAAEKLLGAKMYLTRGGDHSYVDFARRLPAIKYFFDRILAKS